MSTKIIYNGANPFGEQPTPFVAISQSPIYYANKWGEIQEISLDGQLTGCTFEELIDAESGVLANFSESFKTFIIEDDNIPVFSGDSVKVESINFDSSNYVGVLNYNIALSNYINFGDNYGVLDPSDSWSFDEGDNNIVNITHTVSAKGFRTEASDAINNARNFVNLHTGWNQKLKPYFYCATCFNPVLKSYSEEIDRFSATYSVTENYQAGITSEDCANTLLRYEISSSEEYESSGVNDAGYKNSTSFSINGFIESNNIDDARQRLKDFDYTSVAKKFGNYESAAFSKSIQELSGKNQNSLFRIDFSYDYSNEDSVSGSSGIFENYSTSFNEDEKGNISASVDANLFTRQYTGTQAYADLESKFSPSKYKDILGEDFLKISFNGNPKPLDFKLYEESETHNEFEPSINYSFSCNSINPLSISGVEYSFDLSVTCPIEIYGVENLIHNDEQFSFTKIGTSTLKEVSVNGSARILDPKAVTPNAAKSQIKSKIDELVKEVIDGAYYTVEESYNNSVTGSNGQYIESEFSISFGYTEKISAAINSADDVNRLV